MLTRSCAMKRSGFARPVFERKPRQVFPMHRVPAPSAPVFVQTPKDEPVRSEPYRRAVAALPCFRCGIHGLSQAAHADEGKGLAIKACDLTCYPLCGTRLGEPGCHWLVGTSGRINRGERRGLELRGKEATQATLIAQADGNAVLRAVLVKVGLIGGAA